MKDIMGANDIAFPHLGIYLENVPKSFNIGNFPIALYGVIIGLGVLCGVLMAAHMAKKQKFNPDIIWDFAIYAVIFSIMGARLYYVAFSWDSYKNDLLSILNLRQGGLAIYGGVIAAFITLFVYCKFKKASAAMLGDCGVCGLVLGQIIGRWGNFFNREVFGEYTDSLFAMRLPIESVRARDISQSIIDGMSNLPDANFIQVHPTFLYEGVLNLILLIFMICFVKHKKYDGQLCFIYLGGYGIIRFFVEGIRTDQLFIPNTTIPVSQVVGISLFVFSFVMNLIIRACKKKKALVE